MKKQKGTIMRYFWGTFAFHIIVYAFLTHVLIRHFHDREVVLASLAGLAITIPFTVVMIQRFKKMALTRTGQTDASSILLYAEKQYSLLRGFFSFKTKYEMVLIPIQTIIGVFITFRLFFPGGIKEHPMGALIVFVLTLASCATAIIIENKRSFYKPLEDLKNLLDEFRPEPGDH